MVTNAKPPASVTSPPAVHEGQSPIGVSSISSMDIEGLHQLLGSWGYLGFLVLLVLTGVGSPIPEDLLLLVSGYLVSVSAFDARVVIPLGIAGVLGSDVLLYSAGRHLAWRAGRKESRLISPQRLDTATRWLTRLGDGAIILARLLPGTRTIVFVSAGAQGVPFVRFVAADVLGAILWVPALCAVGYWLGSGIGGLEALDARLRQGALWVTAALVLLFIAWLHLGRDESKL
jgi:membrane-associated protein